MSKFALENMNAFSGEVRFHKVIKDGICLIDEFELSLEKDKEKQKQLAKIFQRMERFANKQQLTKKHINTIQDLKNEGVILKELKEKQIRVYFFQTDDDYNNAYVLIGGFVKDKQQKDINKAKKIIKEYLQEIGK